MFSFKTASPESVGIPSAALCDYIRSLDAARHCLHSLTVVKNGALVLDAAYAPMTSTEKHRMYSCSKSFVSAAIGLAQSEGLLRIADPVTRFFPEYDAPNLHPWLKMTTLRDLLCMTDCHDDQTYTMDKNPPDMDWVRTWFDTPPTHRPGTIFQYNTVCTVLLCVVLERVTGMSFVDYLRPRVFEPMGMSPDITCVRTPCGHAWGGSGVLASAHDLAKFAYLCMHGGEADGKQLLPRDYLAQATAKQVDNTLNEDNFEHQQGYGYQFWQLRDGGFGFFGMGSQQAFCYPQHDLVVVLTGDTQAMPSAREVQLARLRDCILRSLSPSPLPENPAKQRELQELAHSLTLRTVEGLPTAPAMKAANGKTYRFSPNRLGWSWARFIFGPQSMLEYENASGKHTIRFTYGESVRQEFDELSIYLMDIGHPGGRSVRAFASGAWTDARTLHLTLYVCDVCFGTLQLTCCFVDDTLTIAAKKNAEWFLTDYQGYATGQA